MIFWRFFRGALLQNLRFFFFFTLQLKNTAIVSATTSFGGAKLLSKPLLGQLIDILFSRTHPTRDVIFLDPPKFLGNGRDHGITWRREPLNQGACVIMWCDDLQPDLRFQVTESLCTVGERCSHLHVSPLLFVEGRLGMSVVGDGEVLKDERKGGMRNDREGGWQRHGRVPSLGNWRHSFGVAGLYLSKSGKWQSRSHGEASVQKLHLPVAVRSWSKWSTKILRELTLLMLDCTAFLPCCNLIARMAWTFLGQHFPKGGTHGGCCDVGITSGQGKC